MLFAVSVVLCLLSLGGIVYFIGKLVREDRRRRDEEVRSRWQPPLDDEECCYPIRPEPQANDLMETVLMASAISDAFNAPAAEYVPEGSRHPTTHRRRARRSTGCSTRLPKR